MRNSCLPSTYGFSMYLPFEDSLVDLFSGVLMTYFRDLFSGDASCLSLFQIEVLDWPNFLLPTFSALFGANLDHFRLPFPLA